MTYLIIFLLKIVENTIATLRLIIVANGKKLLGAVLNFIMSIVWVISTSLVVQNFKNILNPLYNNGSTCKKNDIIIKSV